MVKRENQKEIRKIKLSFQRCKTPKQLVYLWFNLYPKADINTKVDLTVFSDRKLTGPISKAIECVEKSGMWAFYRGNRKNLGGEIFFWLSKKVEPINFIHMLTHEIAHSVGYKNENMANKIASICTFSIYAASKHLRDKIKIK